MRRQSVILAAFFALFLATFAPIRAQEPGDIVAVDSNAGIMTLAAGDIAYKTFDELIKAKAASKYTFWGDYSTNAGTSRAETYRYDYILKDIPDDDEYDSWFYYGCLIAYAKADNASVWNWNRFVFSGELHKMSTGAWAVKKFTVVFGLPGYTGTNVYNVTYDEGANFFTQYVACLRKAFELQKVEDNDQTSIFNADGRYDHYINWVEHDTDNGGVNNLAEWVRGTLINNVYDDKPQGGKCLCGACCECECRCGLWDDVSCNGAATDCDCHAQEPECTCISYCCACKCECKKCADGTHGAHKNGSDTCDGTEGGTIGFAGCDCHKEKEPECECAKYCCKHTCECEKCGDGTHSAHKNDNGECDGTFENCSDCHEEDNPEEDCTCANYCCACKCECKKCKAAGSCSGNHKNGDMKCDGVSSGSTYCCDCHETTDEEECTCANYCCACKCECQKCKAAGACSGNHKNGDQKCDGIASGSTYVCDCHKTDNPEETPCTCENYCCACKCECKKCKAAGSCSGNHKNGGTKCDGVASGAPGGSTYCCDCHKSTDDGEFEAPDDQEFKAPDDEKNQKFIDAQEKFKPSINRLEKAIEDKYQIKNVTKYFSGDFTGDLPSWEFELPGDWGVARVDFNDLEKYDEQLTTVRAVLVALVYLLTAAYVLQTLRKLV